MRKPSPVFWLTLSLASLASGCTVFLFLAATSAADAIQGAWGGDDDWAMLALPLGMVLGLWIGVRYRRSVWLHVLSGLSAACLVALGVYCGGLAVREPGDLGEKIGRMIAVITLVILACSAATAVLLAWIVTIVVQWRERRMARDCYRPR